MHACDVSSEHCIVLRIMCFFYSSVNNIAYHLVAYYAGAGAGVVVVQWYSTYTTFAHIIVCSEL
jgi:hypothetical protein